MSDIVGFVGISHSPFATLLPPGGSGEPGGLFLTSAARAADAVRALAPDAVVVIGPDHFHANFYDLMPPFALGVEEATGFGDFGSAAGKLPVAGELAWDLHAGLSDTGFDVALSYSLTVDHGIVQGYELITGGTDLPLVPLVINTAAPPLPSLRRCAELGAAIRPTQDGSQLDPARMTGSCRTRVLVIARTKPGRL